MEVLKRTKAFPTLDESAKISIQMHSLLASQSNEKSYPEDEVALFRFLPIWLTSNRGFRRS